jgi:beta-lactamase class C
MRAAPLIFAATAILFPACLLAFHAPSANAQPASAPAMNAQPSRVSPKSDEAIQQLLAHKLAPELLGEDSIGGIGVAVYACGQTQYFDFGFADMASHSRVTPDSLFNIASLRKVMEATTLADAVERGEVKLSDPVAQYVTELKAGGAIRAVTLGQLASHTSGLLLPPDHPPWPTKGYSFDEFMSVLNAWTPDPGHAPGEAPRYTHAGYVLLQVALERRFHEPIFHLLEDRLLKPLGMTETVLRERPLHGEPQPPLAGAVQGYGDDGKPIGAPGNQQSYFNFSGTGQMFSSLRDLARLAAANLGGVPVAPSLRAAMLRAQHPVAPYSAHISQAMAWEVSNENGVTIIDKPAGIDNASAYIGLIPDRQIGLVILMNRGNRNPHPIARTTLLPEMARVVSCEL